MAKRASSQGAKDTSEAAVDLSPEMTVHATDQYVTDADAIDACEVSIAEADATMIQVIENIIGEAGVDAGIHKTDSAIHTSDQGMAQSDAFPGYVFA